MEARPEDSRTGVTQNFEIQPNLDSAKEGNTKETAISVDNSVSEGNTKDIGKYGPWMLVKKQPRKKSLGKNKDYSTQDKVPPKGNPLQGSRFDLLQEYEVQEDAKLQDGSESNSTIPKARQEGQAHTPPAANNANNFKIVRIRDPKAGKNSQANQDKRKQQIMLPQKNSSNSKSTPVVPVNHTQQILGPSSKPVMTAEKPSP
ncbi:hypothetical protein SESBI_48142, partial [Sesbania bispinosa]